MICDKNIWHFALKQKTVIHSYVDAWHKKKFMRFNIRFKWLDRDYIESSNIF